MEPQKALSCLVKAILKRDKDEGPTLPGFRTNYKATVNETVWYQHTARHTAQ